MDPHPFNLSPTPSLNVPIWSCFFTVAVRELSPETLLTIERKVKDTVNAAWDAGHPTEASVMGP